MKILLLGPGKMGGAWLQRLVSTDIYQKIEDLYVIQPSMSKKDIYGDYDKVSFFASAADLGAEYKPDIVIIAIKPQIFAEILPLIKKQLSSALVLSVAAGKSIEEMQEYTGGNDRIVRIMPNIGIKIGKSVNLLYASKHLVNRDRELTELLLAPTGNQYWLNNEKEIDQLTPVTGCSPAFYYQLSMELIRKMTEAGFTSDMARKLVSDTLVASASYAKQEDVEYDSLIADVASKGGVTRASLDVMEPVMNNMMDSAYKAAMERIEELKDSSR